MTRSDVSPTLWAMMPMTKFLGPMLLEAGQTHEFKFKFTEIDPPYRPRWFVTASAFAAAFELCEFRINDRSLMPTTHPLPMSIFIEESMGMQLNVEKVARMGDTMTIAVKNVTDKDKLFAAVLLGDDGETIPQMVRPMPAVPIGSSPMLMAVGVGGDGGPGVVPGGAIGPGGMVMPEGGTVVAGPPIEPRWPGVEHDRAAVATIKRYMRIHNLRPEDVEVREFVIGFGPTVISPWARPSEANPYALPPDRLIAEPQVDLFIPRRLLIPTSVGPDFKVHDVRIGKNSQCELPDPISGTDLDENALIRDKNLGRKPMLTFKNAAKLGQKITLNIGNVTDAPKTFSAALIGVGISVRDDLIVESES